MTIALYLRLSLADGDLGTNDKEESNSIENQRELLYAFLEAREDICGEVVEYADDGYTGTSFNRPSFIRMIEDAKTGKIQMIIVKDLSRLGRDYIGVGDYLEQIFPLLGIRFIAVNSRYDSNDYIGKTMGLEMSVSNLVNTLYSRDLSQKQKSVRRTKWRQGKSTMSRLPYGYQKAERDKTKWEIDPVAGKVVRLIFDKALEGDTTGQIAAYLNSQNIPTVGAYREKHLQETRFANRVLPDSEWLWHPAMVWNIIKNYTYTGALIQGKHTTTKVGKRTALPQDEWYITEGTHPAIVSKLEYLAAQDILQTRARTFPQKSNYLLRGKVKCGNCGKRMAFFENKQLYLRCPHKSVTGKYSKCDSHEYAAESIEKVVFAALKERLRMFEAYTGRLVKLEQQCRKTNAVEAGRLKKEAETLRAKRIHLYEVYSDGTISKEQYLKEKEQLSTRIEKAETAIAQMTESDSAGCELEKQYENVVPHSNGSSILNDLTRESMGYFIDSIIIYSPEEMEVRFIFEDVLEQIVERIEKLSEINASDG